jgi:hypothetical protein
MQDFEKLGVFYLGREFDLGSGTRRDQLVLYDSSDLVTHAVIIGMTGSGKTGLGIGLLEEAAIDAIPALVIDPKGDLGNLLLSFPALAPQDFRPWINLDDAARTGMEPDAYAARQAELWARGLAEWGQDGARIAHYRDAANVAIYTPGSTTGIPLSVLRSFSAPPPEIRGDAELMGERIGTSVSGLLGLIGVDADPVRSREHILLSTILGHAWRHAEDLDLGGLIQRVQSPPVTRVGVLDLETFYPASDRFAFAMRLNGLLAAPAFATWLEGDPLDVDRLLYTPEGRPRLAVISIAHLGDAERMFFVSLLLAQVLSWMRRQSGTTSLRALIYMDEVAGYLPPVANPSSKAPLLTLLKQARAFGLGVVLATQNPVDLDYKGLSNTGTWFLGRLQTEQDKARVLDGLQGAIAGAGAFDRATMDRALSGLGKRVFLLHNVHDTGPVVFETRWTMSYLRGPLTREQIRTLMSKRPMAPDVVVGGSAAATTPMSPVTAPAVSQTSAAAPAASAVTGRPVLPPAVPQFFLPVRGDGPVHYVPRLLGTGQVEFSDPKLGVAETRDISVVFRFAEGPLGVEWDAAQEVSFRLADLATDPAPQGVFAELPPAAAQSGNYARWTKGFERWVQQNQAVAVWRHGASGLTSRPGEDERDFRIRLQQVYRERRDQARDTLRQKYAPKVAALAERIRRAEATREREAEQASAQKMQAGFSIAATVLGAVLGRKGLSVGTVGRASTAARSMGRTQKEAQDVKRADATVAALVAQREELEGALAAEVAALETGPDALAAPLDELSVRPKKSGIHLQRVLLLWAASEALRA